ncbi:hypothetical protein CLAFUR0_13498 [Fulvia fulva]|nr:hypothetical protein CLAFUR0_13498 [Fulvia fulva]
MATQTITTSLECDSISIKAPESPTRDAYNDLMKQFGLKPPKNDASTNFDKFMDMRTQAFSILMQLRKSLHHHMGRDDLEKQLNLGEFQELLGGMDSRIEQQDFQAPAKRLGRVHEIPVMIPKMVDTTDAISDMLNDILPICRAASGEPALYIDCEGVDLGRDGSVTMLSIHCPENGEVYLVDLLTLQDSAITTTGTGRYNQYVTLKTILEARNVVKGMWDCRKDSDALYAHYNIKLAGVLDIQLMDIITKREKDRKQLIGLESAFTSKLNVTPDEEISINVLSHCAKVGMEEGAVEMHRIFQMVKGQRAGVKYRPTVASSAEDAISYRVKHGLAKSAMEERPLPVAMSQSCAQDVLMMPMLYQYYSEHSHYHEERQKAVELESHSRVGRAREPVWPWDDMIAPPSAWKHAYVKKVKKERRRDSAVQA